MKLIVAVDENWGIGKDGHLLCHLSQDLQYFKEKTLDQVVVMGLNTLLSLPGSKPLPHRDNVLLAFPSDDTKAYEEMGVKVVHSIEEVLDMEKDYPDKSMFIIGGASVYNQFIPYCDTCYITKIHERFDADVHIENLDQNEDFIIKKHTGVKEEKGIKFQFLEYKRIK
ncbi:MAG: dihydrofolate reductase [Clostridia bacterium]|nr:dihydrofolate reductase [Clostridia bacterium]